MHPAGSVVYQPSAMGLIVNAASKVPGLLKGCDKIKAQKGNQLAMTWLINQINEYDSTFTAELPLELSAG